jgi:hypothetical protein
MVAFEGSDEGPRLELPHRLQIAVALGGLQVGQARVTREGTLHIGAMYSPRGQSMFTAVSFDNVHSFIGIIITLLIHARM